MNLDRQLLYLLNRGLTHPILDGLMILLSLATTPVPMLAAILACCQRRERLLGLGAFVGATVSAVALQFLLGQPRPADVRLILPMPPFPSFPSGQSAAAWALATLGTLRRPRRCWPALPGAALVALSRVYLGHHYPSDVLGGAILGAAVAAMAHGLSGSPAQTRRPRWAWLLWGQLATVALATLAASLGIVRFAFLSLPGADKALHFLLFGLLAFLAVGWWSKRPAWQTIAATAALALLEEASQWLFPGRSVDLMDLHAALAGIMLAGWLGRTLRGSAINRRAPHQDAKASR